MGPKDFRAEARLVLAGNWLLSALAALIAGLLGGLITTSGSIIAMDENQFDLLQSLSGLLNIPDLGAAVRKILLPISLTAGLVAFFIGGTVRLGHCQYLLDQQRSRKLKIDTLFSHFYQWNNGFTLGVMTALFTVLWSMLLIIPGIIASYRYAMAPFIQAEHPEYTAMESIAASKQMMQGHKMELFCLDLSFIGWVILNIFTLGIGSVFLHAYRSAAYAAFYENVCPEI